MIEVTSAGGTPILVAETKGYGIYLDNDSLIDLAKGMIGFASSHLSSMRDLKRALDYNGSNVVAKMVFAKDNFENIRTVSHIISIFCAPTGSA